jgi:hypothetical protein
MVTVHSLNDAFGIQVPQAQAGAAIRIYFLNKELLNIEKTVHWRWATGSGFFETFR